MTKHTELHNEIMNLQIGEDCPEDLPARLLYKQGHRDARHAAAELAAEHENNYARLVEALRDAADAMEAFNRAPGATRDEWEFECEVKEIENLLGESK